MLSHCKFKCVLSVSLNSSWKNGNLTKDFTFISSQHVSTWWFWNDRLNIATNKEFYKSARPRKTCEFGLTTELQLLHLLLNPVYYIVLSWVKSCTCKPQHYVNANKGFPKWRENYVPMLKCKIAHIELCAVGLYLHTWKA